MESRLPELPHAHPRHHNDTEQSPPDSTKRDSLSQQSRYAFLNHSAATVNQNLPPNVDDKPLARQRRRRTSPEDQTILEEAYTRDPKPDKAARLELVKQVSLGEKEVQIWFQNRRQTSRRKSRPLLPHEIAQYHLARSGVTSQIYSPELTSDCSPEQDLQPSSDPADDLSPRSEMSQVSSKDIDPGSDILQSGKHESSCSDSHGEQARSRAAPVEQTSRISLPLPETPSESTGSWSHAADSKHVPALRRSQSLHKSASAFTHITQAEPAGRLKKSSSLIRISLSGDGNAKLVTKDTLSPSPPHASHAPPPAPLGNTQANISNPSVNVPPMRSLQRSSSGRSRDSRVWEFWCDKDTRSELEEKAEQDASGSAAGAIGLIRSASGRNVLGSIPSKRNAVLSRQPISSKRSKVEATAPKFHKSSTALGRLEWMPKESQSLHAVPSIKPTPSNVHIPGNESDKENWSPSTAISPDSHSEHSAVDVGMPAVMNAASLKRQRTSFSHAESNRPDIDPEVAAFMSGAPKRSNVSEDVELDCVQGLLSLSQGNWR